LVTEQIFNECRYNFSYIWGYGEKPSSYVK